MRRCWWPRLRLRADFLQGIVGVVVCRRAGVDCEDDEAVGTVDGGARGYGTLSLNATRANGWVFESLIAPEPFKGDSTIDCESILGG